MIDKIVQIIGYTVMFSMLLISLGFLLMGIYYIYDYWLKKLLGWKERELRADLFYFIKHKEEIRNIIKDRKD